MNTYRSKRNITMIIDMIGITLSFMLSLGLRFNLLSKTIGINMIISTYITFFSYALLIYVFLSLFKGSPRLERQSYREIIMNTVEHQIVFVVAYIVFFFIFHQADVISRMVVIFFFAGNVILCSIGRIFYHNYCVLYENFIKCC